MQPDLILDPVRESKVFCDLLSAAMDFDLPQWLIVGGSVRDLFWSRIYGRQYQPRDIDLIYFHADTGTREFDEEIETKLSQLTGWKWSVKNQSRMNERNGDPPYGNTLTAMSKFPLTVSSIGVKLDRSKWITPVSIYGFDELYKPAFIPTPVFSRPERSKNFAQFMERNGLLKRWPEVPLRASVLDRNS